MAVFNGGVSLADIYAAADASKANQQRMSLGAIALQNAQRDQTQQGIIDAATANPASTQADYGKAGIAGIKAYTDVQQSTAMADKVTYQKLASVGAAVAAADDPHAAVNQLAPGFGADYDKQHGAGSFAQLTPAQLKQYAGNVSTHAIEFLTNPDTKFKEQHDDARNMNSQLHEDARSGANRAAEDARAAAGRAVTIRGQDLEAGRSNKPQLVDVPNADGTTTKKWIIPGQIEGPTVGTSPAGAKLSETQGNAKAFGLRAQDANATLESMISGPNAYDPTGIGARKDALTAGGTFNNLASDAGQKYQNVAKAFIAPILRKESGAAISESEWASAKQLYIPIPGDSATVLEQKARNRADAIEGLKVQAGPTGLPDVKAPTGTASTTPSQTAAPQAPRPGSLVKGYRFKGGDPSKPESWVKASG
jgi:hypothetical protein